jgi:hypothetical protein
VRLAVVRSGRAEKAIERFLKQVVRELTVTGNTSEIRPQSARGLLVERAKCVLVHHKSGKRVIQGAQSRRASVNVVS